MAAFWWNKCSTARQAGSLPGDVITHVNGRPVARLHDLAHEMQRIGIGISATRSV